jgi:branched-chain amino acid transport system substrate-binding protein
MIHGKYLLASLTSDPDFCNRKSRKKGGIATFFSAKGFLNRKPEDSEVSEMTKKNVIWIFLVPIITILIGGVGFVNTPQASAKEPVKVGCVIPLTGPFARIAAAQKDGIQLAAKEINARGGVLGRPIELFIRDSELNATIAVRRLQDLVTKEKIDWHVGTLSGGITFAANQILKKYNIPYMSSCQTVEKFHEKGVTGPYSFTVATVTYTVGYSAAEYIITKMGAKKLYILYADYAWGQTNRDGVVAGAKKFGGEVIGMDAAPLGGASDFSPYLVKARALKPDGFVLCCPGGMALTGIKQIYELGLSKEMKVFSSWVALPIGMGCVKEFQGMYGGIDFLWTLDDPVTKKFVKAAWDEYGKPPDSYTYCTYTGLNELTWAANKVGSLDPAKMVAALTSPDHKFNYGKGEAYWRPCDRRAIQNWFIVKGKKLEDIKKKYDIYEHIGTVGTAPEYNISCKELGY